MTGRTSANKAAAFDATFLVLHAILEPYSSELIVSVDKPATDDHIPFSEEEDAG
jgi:hypothetical protein